MWVWLNPNISWSIHSRKLAWQWKNLMFNRKCIFKWGYISISYKSWDFLQKISPNELSRLDWWCDHRHPKRCPGAKFAASTSKISTNHPQVSPNCSNPRIRLHHFGQHPTSGFFLANGRILRWSSKRFLPKKAGLHRVLIGFVQDEHDHNLLNKGPGWGDVFLQMSQESRSLSIKVMILRDTCDLILFDYLDPNWHTYLYPYPVPSPLFPRFFLSLRSLAM